MNVSIQDFESIPNFIILELLSTVLFLATAVGRGLLRSSVHISIEMYMLMMCCMIQVSVLKKDNTGEIHLSKDHDYYF